MYSSLSESSRNILLSEGSGRFYDIINDTISENPNTGNTPVNPANIPVSPPLSFEDKRAIVIEILHNQLHSQIYSDIYTSEDFPLGARFDTVDKRKYLVEVYEASPGTHYRSDYNPNPKVIPESYKRLYGTQGTTW